MLTQNGVQDRAPSKFLETQHWLELVDGCVCALDLLRSAFSDARIGNTVMGLTVELHLLCVEADYSRVYFFTPRQSRQAARLEAGGAARLNLN